MKKFLHIVEYAKGMKIPEKLDEEYEFYYCNSIFRTSIKEASSKEKVKESFDPYYNNVKLDEQVIDLGNILIYDNIDIKDDQTLAYVYECPVCLNKTITSDKNLDYCPQCEQTKFPFDLIAIVNTDQMEDIAIKNDDVSTLIIVNGDKIVFKETKKEDSVM
nr:hypothetical protein DGKKSRWO_DGKKSRWO_CDS_0047 [uncultured phage]CAI9752193.1 hypothetical protein CVNMHQAP_CVNMHQAP_CDS_0047 [uncultured phage]